MTNNFSLPSNENKLLGLEIVRFLSALSILILHYQNFGYVSIGEISLQGAIINDIVFNKNQQPFYSYLNFFYNHGHFAVYIFFCISGFIFFWKYRELISNKTVGAKDFFIARFARLYPLHLVTLILVASLQLIYFKINNNFFMWNNNDFFHFFLQLFMASDWGFQQGPSFNSPIWSISVEVLVYFLFFLILRYISKSILINIILVIFCLLARAYEIPYTSHPVIACIGLFYIGGISAIILKTLNKRKFKLFLNIISFFAVIFIPVMILQFNFLDIFYTSPLDKSQAEIVRKIFIFFYTPLLLYIFAQYIGAKPLIRKCIEVAGNLTYSSYLIHIPFQILIVIFFSLINKKIPIYNTFFFLSYIFLTLLISYFTFRYFEAPARKLIKIKLSK